MTISIFCRFALLGEDLTLKENVEVLISDNGRIENITTNVDKSSCSFNYTFENHLPLPKFINSHTHIGDALLKDSAHNSSLKSAVGPNGIKFQINSFTREERVNAMRNSMKEMIDCGISTCLDFREGGIIGVYEIEEAMNGLPIHIKLLGRTNSATKVNLLLDKVMGLGYQERVRAKG